MSQQLAVISPQFGDLSPIDGSVATSSGRWEKPTGDC
jgi:hypothetical protein